MIVDVEKQDETNNIINNNIRTILSTIKQIQNTIPNEIIVPNIQYSKINQTDNIKYITIIPRSNTYDSSPKKNHVK